MARRTLDSVTVQEIFDECTTAHNELRRNRGFFPWQLLLGTKRTLRRSCHFENVAKKFIKPDLGDIHWALGEWCWYWRSGKHNRSRMKGGVFLGPARVLILEREMTAEGVRMKGVVWITEGTSLV